MSTCVYVGMTAMHCLICVIFLSSCDLYMRLSLSIHRLAPTFTWALAQWERHCRPICRSRCTENSLKQSRPLLDMAHFCDHVCSMSMGTRNTDLLSRYLSWDPDTTPWRSSCSTEHIVNFYSNTYHNDDFRSSTPTKHWSRERTKCNRKPLHKIRASHQTVDLCALHHIMTSNSKWLAS